MIINKLSEILGRKKLKIADVIKDTGITRPTLTSLYYGQSTGINFNTLNKLCKYLNIETGDIFKFYDIDIKSIDLSFAHAAEFGNEIATPAYVVYNATVLFEQSSIKPLMCTIQITPCNYRLINIDIALTLTESEFSQIFPLDIKEIILHKITSSAYNYFVRDNDEKTDIDKVSVSYALKRNAGSDLKN